MNIDEIKAEGAIEYIGDVLEGLDQLAEISTDNESKTIKKIISTIEAMMAYDFKLAAHKLDS